MRCPRCGLENASHVVACARCGLPAPASQSRPTPPPGQPPTSPRAPARPAGSPPPVDEQRDVTHRGAAGAAPYPSQDRAPHGAQFSQQQAAPPQPGPPQAGHLQAGPPWGVQQTYAPAPYRQAGAEEDGRRRDTFGLVTTLVLTIGAVLSLGYAVWSVTARRGIFADFAAGTIPSDSEISTSDTLDLVFILLAGTVALVGLGLWVVRRSGGRTRGGSVEMVGLVAAGLGLVTILVALVLQDRSVADGTQAEQGDRAATASVVMGAGFTVLAIALLVGLLVNRPANRG